MAKYRVLVGVEYASRRAEPGEIVDDIPAKSIKWLREQGLIEAVDAKGAIVESDDEPITEGVEE
ncbi:hypothetical protein UFOVP711_25 [uncultured Caudovirales phage]|uniref:Uncharacterized protein n=1 Tax=uncultured Caudovirales phage TaxID=2100421 RepID=A0A6J5NJ97_9CAUD|nr:hypothetical protein UFOVP711_25 [uncultured Caudovirales phage]